MRIKIRETFCRKTNARELYHSEMQSLDQFGRTEYESILAMSRPRTVKLKVVPLTLLISFPVLALFLFVTGILRRATASRFASKTSPDDVIVDFIAPILLVALSCFLFWLTHRDRQLLRTGELTLGVVTHQWIAQTGGFGGRRSSNKIRYRFKNSFGEIFQSTGTDDSRTLLVDMTLAVFYELENPEKNVTLCAAMCELTHF